MYRSLFFFFYYLQDDRHLPTPCVVDSAVYGTKLAHTMAGIPSPTDNLLLKGLVCFQKDFRFDEVSIRGMIYTLSHEGFMIIKVLKSKNDQLRKGDESK